ncbi:MAG TPA: DUF2132 domain-containing protein [Gammaproteobacteria bacterium]|nr:DUF2132 domain-containing protein [Gammaproteobacteria bacterium]
MVLTLEQTSKNRHQDPLHGVTLKTIVNELIEYFGWEELGNRIDIKCFKINPSINSSLKFLRKTPWARKKVEDLYLKMVA